MERIAQRIGLEVPRAGAFIVTLYGDVVEPRGGVLSMASAIALCAEVGISETLVRTAMSRLVNSEQLAGARIGRRSYYRLTEAARPDFARAARLLFAPAPPPRRWIMGTEQCAGCAPLGGGLFVGPDPDAPASASAGRAVFHATSGADVREFAARHWDLQPIRAGYERVIARFSPWLTAPQSAPDSLTLRLVLVHDYRAVLLADPVLPVEALPPDWPGPEARRVFAALYRQLTPGAEAQIAAICDGPDGALPAETEATVARLDTIDEPG